ncbi:hypothetical protein P43SY_002004 [Pythium insidiosum]|uniref:Cilia- and flagella-associated protein 157 n=1 Tax=Pythium insidiosum TaxID=114742 RepID=A0AAD5QB62_PYTIN|nr:hypothetical protein P43SY_002004 [Pythium insidiosum]
MADATPPSSASAGAGAMLLASDFFGANDPEGTDKFKTIALRALYDQKMEDDLRSTRAEAERLAHENAALATQLRELRAAMDANIDDRERVLAFKSKRIEELLIKVKELEAINSSLLHTLRGGGKRAGPVQPSPSPSQSPQPSASESQDAASGSGDAATTGTAGASPSSSPSSSSSTATAASPLACDNAGRHTRASMQLLQRGEPLFHAVETCKELEYKRLLDEKRQHCDALQQQIESDRRLVAEMQQFAQQRSDWTARIAALESEVRETRLERDDKVHFLERKLVIEHDRLSKEKAAELQACRDSMAQQMRTQLDVTTQKTIEENVRVQLELRYQSAQLERFVQQLDALRSEHRALQNEKRLVEDMNVTLSRKLKFFEQLFAKMQQRDHRQSRALASREDSRQGSSGMSPPPTATSMGSFLPSPSPSSPNGRRRRPTRKPPLPALVLRATGSSFALTPSSPTPSCPSPCPCPSPLPTPSPRRSVVRNPDFPLESGEQLTLDLSLLGLETADTGPLSSAASALDAHLLQREFARKQVDAMLQHRRESPVPRRHAPQRLAGRTHARSSPSRAGRKFREAPLTLHSFIAEQYPPHQQQQPPPRQREEQQEEEEAAAAEDPTALWRRPQGDAFSPSSPSIRSARF